MQISKEKRIKILGICLGMQLLFDGSEEFGNTKGLGIIKGWVRKIPENNQLYKIPNIGWRETHWLESNSYIYNKENKEFFYYIHSYWCDCKNKENIIAFVEMGFEMTVAVKNKNVVGVQFHPEKSQDSGYNFLSKYIENFN